jgi:hypothetical protein
LRRVAELVALVGANEEFEPFRACVSADLLVVLEAV